MDTTRFDQRFLTEIKDLLPVLKNAEGYRRFPYPDSKGIITIGYGLNLESDGMEEPVAEYAMLYKLNEIDSHLQKTYRWYNDLSILRRSALLNMVYNVGINGFSKFHNTIQALERKDYKVASKEILNSDAAREHAKTNNPRWINIAKDIEG